MMDENNTLEQHVAQKQMAGTEGDSYSCIS